MSQSLRSAGLATVALIIYTAGEYLRGDLLIPALSLSGLRFW